MRVQANRHPIGARTAPDLASMNIAWRAARMSAEIVLMPRGSIARMSPVQHAIGRKIAEDRRRPDPADPGASV